MVAGSGDGDDDGSDSFENQDCEGDDDCYGVVSFAATETVSYCVTEIGYRKPPGKGSRRSFFEPVEDQRKVVAAAVFEVAVVNMPNSRPARSIVSLATPFL